MSNPLIITIVIIYLITMIIIGIFASKKVSSSTDFALAGRNLGPVILAATLAATNIGGGTSLGITEQAFGKWGFSAIWYVITAAIAFIVLAFITPRFRATMVTTVSEYFEKRYGKANSLVTAIIMGLPMIGITAAQIMASATILTVMTGWDYTMSVIIVTIVVTIYSCMGGLWGVAITDFIQGILIFFGSLIAIPFALKYAGGVTHVISNLTPEQMSLTQGVGIPTIISLTIMYIASYAVGPEISQRFLSAKNEKALMYGSLSSGIICILYACLPALLGVIASSIVKDGLITSEVLTSRGTRYILPILAHYTMPPIIVGLLFSALISATMSSADSDMLAVSTIVTNDIYKKFINTKAQDKELLILSRITIVAVGLFAMFIAFVAKNIISILMFSFSLRAAGVFVPYLFAHYTQKKLSPVASMASLIGGSVVTLFFQYNKSINLFGVDPIIPGIIVSALVFFCISAIIKPKD
ncbi:MAG: sodium:solute symporter family protein [Treponemataceae bacterium]